MSYRGDGALYFGASAAPRTITPIAQFQIPCLIKNTSNPQAPGTLIGKDSTDDAMPVKGITNLNNMAMINVSGPGMKGMVGMAARVFAVMSRAGISVVLITQSSSQHQLLRAAGRTARPPRAGGGVLSGVERRRAGSAGRHGTRRSSRWSATACAPCVVSPRALARANINIVAIARALPSVQFRWWSAMIPPPPACASATRCCSTPIR